MRSVLISTLLIVVASRVAAQTVIWTTNDPGQSVAIGIAGLMDEVLAEQQRLRSTPMVHRKIGLRPALGEETLARAGEVVVARVPYQASYVARPRFDFVNTKGAAIRADSLRTMRMLNNLFCAPRGGHCFEDKDRDGDWDSAGQESGRWIDVPYELIELRKELPGEERREVVLVSLEGPILEYREWLGAALVSKSTCLANASQEFQCGNMALKEIGREGDGVRFQVEESKENAIKH
jgi:hypothetical protein